MLAQYYCHNHAKSTCPSNPCRLLSTHPPFVAGTLWLCEPGLRSRRGPGSQDPQWEGLAATHSRHPGETLPLKPTPAGGVTGSVPIKLSCICE
eukprot:2880168-Amphidinium_carterae.1